MPIQWSEKHSVNIKAIDEQHKYFVQMLNSLYDSVHRLDINKNLGSALQDLVDYTIAHFKTEEELFDQYAYPDTEIHKKEHQMLLKKASEFMEKYKAGNEDIILELIDFLEDWLVNHLTGMDKKYTAFLNDKGVY